MRSNPGASVKLLLFVIGHPISFRGAVPLHDGVIYEELFKHADEHVPNFVANLGSSTRKQGTSRNLTRLPSSQMPTKGRKYFRIRFLVTCGLAQGAREGSCVGQTTGMSAAMTEKKKKQNL
jgi:hypothetical protein